MKAPRTAVLPLNEKIRQLASQMQCFEAPPSRSKTGTGARREGSAFERLANDLWDAVRCFAEERGARTTLVRATDNRHYAQLRVESRSLYLPGSASDLACDLAPPQLRWLDVSFDVSNMVARFPGEATAIRRYSPDTGPYAGPRYPGIYAGLRTRFDDTVVLEENGVLREKILIEYKTAKSSPHRQIDGNAHERLSFQIMQYLEVATWYTRCSLAVIANGAYIRYRNKYHTSFHVQADRLRNFAWFRMEFACTAGQYCRFVRSLLSWLFMGTPRSGVEWH